ncbi:hypothetical protein MMC12_007484 [Toensbergia leucococca]|nr:hypothetical protein [Toensbergia leucococca]
MVRFIPPPDPRTLLPPLLACLPTAFVAPRPPPALIPLLSPILRQRVQLLSASSTSPSDSWLPLLCWESQAGEQLKEIVESDAFELHPVSGEVEFLAADETQYRRLDEETLQARITIKDLELDVLYLWCVGDQEGGGDGWRVSEVMPLNPRKPGSESAKLWWPTITKADEKAEEIMMAEALEEAAYSEKTIAPDVDANWEDDDDDYWAQYDNTPGRTPAQKKSPTLNGKSDASRPTRATSDAEYYAQYAQVQPALDNDDPSEDRDAVGESSLSGNEVTSSVNQPESINHTTNSHARESPESHNDHDPEPGLTHPRPSSAGSGTATVSRLEDSAAVQSHAEVSIRQHVSTSIKSLFRLARGTGMEKPEFERLIRLELDALSMMAMDD